MTEEEEYPLYTITTTDHPTKFVVGPDGKHFAIDCDPGQVSDGYHTFDELYAHRCKLFAALLVCVNEFASFSYSPFKTMKNDKGEEWEGWFIAGLHTAAGQITYHLPIAMWDSLPLRVLAQNDEYDGHTGADVLERLDKLMKEWYA